MQNKKLKKVTKENSEKYLRTVIFEFLFSLLLLIPLYGAAYLFLYVFSIHGGVANTVDYLGYFFAIFALYVTWLSVNKLCELVRLLKISASKKELQPSINPWSVSFEKLAKIFLIFSAVLIAVPAVTFVFFAIVLLIVTGLSADKSILHDCVLAVVVFSVCFAILFEGHRRLSKGQPKSAFAYALSIPLLACICMFVFVFK